MQSIKVSDCFTKHACVIHETDSISHATELLLKHHLIGAPVINQHHKLVGWFAENESLTELLKSGYYFEETSLVKDVMKKEVLSYTLDTGILDIAQQMIKDKPKIYPVIDDERKLIGIISRRDIIKAIFAYQSPI